MGFKPRQVHRQTGQQTAKHALSILLSHEEGFHIPSREEKKLLVSAYAARGCVVYGQAFDAIHLPQGERPRIGDTTWLEDNLDSIKLIEVKSTSKEAVHSNWHGFFFSLTTAELLVAQSLGEQYRFAFVNTLSGEYDEMSLQEVFGRARKIYPTWSIQF